jgi:hypothetical protein
MVACSGGVSFASAVGGSEDEWPSEWKSDMPHIAWDAGLVCVALLE